MEQLNMNQLLNRLNEEKTIKDALIDFDSILFGVGLEAPGSL